MPTSVGPNTYGEENLVFGFDTGDTVNSYKGEPTTNNIPSQRYSIELSRAVQDVSASWSESEQAWYVTLPSGSETHYRGIRLENDINQYTTYEPTGSDVTFSYNIQALSDGLWSFIDHNNAAVTGSQSYGNDNRSYTAGGTSFALEKGKVYRAKGSYITQANDPLMTGSLYKCYTTMCLAPANETNTSFLLTGAISETKTVKIWNIQHELKDHATQFTTGTRTNTDSLVDIAGTGSVDLSNVSFDSNAQMTFDGTDDYLTLPDIDTYSSTAKFTIEGVVRARGGNWGRIFTNGSNGVSGGVTGFINTDLIISTSSSRPYIQLRVGNSGFILATQISIKTWDNDDFVMYFAFSANKESRTGTYLFRFGQNNGLIQEELSGTYTPGTATGFVENRLGAETDNEAYARMDMYMFKMYDRELSLSEMRKNYNAIKGRFNI